MMPVILPITAKYGWYKKVFPLILGASSFFVFYVHLTVRMFFKVGVFTPDDVADEGMNIFPRN